MLQLRPDQPPASAGSKALASADPRVRHCQQTRSDQTPETRPIGPLHNGHNSGLIVPTSMSRKKGISQDSQARQLPASVTGFQLGA